MFGRELEPDHVHAGLGGGRIIGTIARLVVGDELLDLPEVLVAHRGNPRSFGRRSCDTGQLAHGRERQLTSREHCREPWQVAECPRHAQAILSRTRRVAQHAFEVIQHRHHAERAPDLQFLRLAQPARLLGIERGAAPPDRSQRAVNGLPVEPGVPRRWFVCPRGRRRAFDHCISDSAVQHDSLPLLSRIASSTRVFGAVVCALRDDPGPPSRNCGLHAISPLQRTPVGLASQSMNRSPRGIRLSFAVRQAESTPQRADAVKCRSVNAHSPNTVLCHPARDEDRARVADGESDASLARPQRGEALQQTQLAIEQGTRLLALDLPAHASARSSAPRISPALPYAMSKNGSAARTGGTSICATSVRCADTGGLPGGSIDGSVIAGGGSALRWTRTPSPARLVFQRGSLRPTWARPRTSRRSARGRARTGAGRPGREGRRRRDVSCVHCLQSWTAEARTISTCPLPS